MPKISKRNKIAVAIGSGAVVVASAGAAFAYFTSNGSADGGFPVAQAGAWTVSLGDTSGGPVAPGVSGTDETISYTVTNAGTGYQELNSVVVSIANANGTAWAPSKLAGFTSEDACAANDFSLSGNTAGQSATVTPQVDLAPNDVYSGSFTVHMMDNGAPQDNCQGATSVPYHIAAS